MIFSLYKFVLFLFSSISSSCISVDFLLKSACFRSSATNVLKKLFGTMAVEFTNNCNGDSLISGKEELTHLFLGGYLGFVVAGNAFVDMFKNNVEFGLHSVGFPSGI